jgi:hypothetical protein
MIYEYKEPLWKDSDSPIISLSNTNSTWTELGANPVLRSERLATNRLSHGSANMRHREIEFNGVNWILPAQEREWLGTRLTILKIL